MTVAEGGGLGSKAKSCRVTVFDITKQKALILASIKQLLEGIQ